MSNMEKALALARLGVFVFPCYPAETWVGQNLHETKSPLTPRGVLDASDQPAQIADWWARWPDALVGAEMRRSFLVALDIDMDSEKGIDGIDSLAVAGIEPQQTFNYRTARGGEHHIYADTTGGNLGPTKDHALPSGERLKGIDRRAGNSYVIWWGDVPSTRVGFTPVPEWFAGQSSVTGATYEGTVEQWLNGLPAGDADVLVEIECGKIPVDDFGHSEMIRRQTSIVKLGSEGHPGVAESLERLRNAWLRGAYNTPENERAWNVALAGIVAKAGGHTETEADFWKRRPVLSSIRQNALRTYTAPWSMLGGALLRALDTVPYFIRFESMRGPAALNAMVANVGPSGGGKSLLQNQLDRALYFEGGDKQRTREVGSGEAIASAFVTDPKKRDENGEPLWANRRHAAMFSFDEVGRLTAMGARSGSTIFEYLKTGWSGGMLGRSLAGGDGLELDAFSYRMTAYLNVQPDRAEPLLTDDEIAGGFPGRLLWFSTQDPEVASAHDDTPVEPYNVRQLNWNDGGKSHMVIALPEMNAAFAAQQIAFHTGTRSDLDGHELLSRSKVAAALMVLDGRMALNSEDWELAGVVTNQSNSVRKSVQDRLSKVIQAQTVQSGRAQGERAFYAVESEHDLSVQRVARLLEKRRDEGKPEDEWRHSLPSRDRKLYGEARVAMSVETASALKLVA